MRAIWRMHQKIARIARRSETAAKTLPGLPLGVSLVGAGVGERGQHPAYPNATLTAGASG